MRPQNEAQTNWYAARTLPMPDADERGIESILIWIERRNGGWAVGRASDLAQRQYSEPRRHDFVFEGFDLDDALNAANEALEDELQAAEMDGLDPDNVRPFTRREVQEPLNEWFWGRRAV